MSARAIIGLLVVMSSVFSSTAAAQDPEAASRIAAQREAMEQFKAMNGAWRGPAWILTPTGEKREFIQTERMGPFLDGSVKVIEGRGHSPDGGITFNAFGVVSYSPLTKSFTMRSYAQGRSGDFAITPTPDGYQWQVPAGPNASIKYVATIKDGTLFEFGDRIVEGKEPVRVFEMRLKRIGDSDWPVAGAIGPR